MPTTGWSPGSSGWPTTPPPPSSSSAGPATRCPTGVPIGISVDGAEGPGAYGLNRNVTLTVLAGKGGTVTANYALVQPSVQADAPKILAEVAELVGGEVPPLEELMPDQARGARCGRAVPTRRTRGSRSCCGR